MKRKRFSEEQVIAIPPLALPGAGCRHAAARPPDELSVRQWPSGSIGIRALIVLSSVAHCRLRWVPGKAPMSDVKYDAFLSHATPDIAVAKRICDALAASGLSCFFAPDGQMREGRFLEQLVAAVKASNALVLLVSAASANSEYVRWEARVASESGCDIIPVLVEDVKLPLDNSLFVLTYELQDVRLFSDEAKGIARLLEILGERVGKAVSSQPQPAVPPETPQVPAPARRPDAGSPPSSSSQQKFDREKFVAEVKLRADRGDREALYVLGRLYADGAGVGKDETQAVRLYRLASEGDRGLPEAMHALATCYRKAKGVGRDFPRMLKYYNLAAERGFTPSIYDLGRAYEAGWGVPPDNVQAFKWFLSAANLGSAPAQYAVARMSLSGVGAPVNDANALSFAQMAARQHYGPALNLMGRLFRKGRGVAQDDAEACKWYKLGLEQGNPDAALNLGAMYERGLGVEANKEVAGALYALAQALREA